VDECDGGRAAAVVIEGRSTGPKLEGTYSQYVLQWLDKV
jgi:hypothetical protein